MIKINELEEHLYWFKKNDKGKTIEQFIEYIKQKQNTLKRGGIVSLDEREAYARLKEMKRRQAEIDIVDPDKEYKSLRI